MGWQAFVTDALTEIGCSQIADQIIELATQPDGLGRLADVATLRLLRVPESKYANLSAILTKLRVSRLRDAFGGDWADEVELRWPGPIAHELHRFRELLERSHVVDAVWQFKDFAEIFLKLPALVMLSDLLVIPQCPASTKERLRSAFLGRRLSLGGWIATVRDVLVPLANDTLSIQAAPKAFLPRLFGLFDKKTSSGKAAFDALADVVTWRNRFYGHGAFSLESDFLLDQLTPPALKLAEVVANAARLSPWEDAVLEALTPGGFADLTGWQTIRHHHERGVPHAKPDEAMLPIKLRRGFRVLDLSPYVALRRCPHCRKQDPFIFDSRDGRQVSLLDYVAGHPMKRDETAIAGMAAATAGVENITSSDPTIGSAIESGDLRYKTLANAKVEGELDRKALASRYRPPRYMRNAIRAFIEAHDRGIFWLAGPSMIGKTIFVHGLAGTSGSPLDEPLIDDLGVVAFHIREGQQVRPRHMIGRLDHALSTLFEVAESRRPPLEIETREQPAKSFAEWLKEFFRLTTHKYRKLLVCLDGLDELPEFSEGELSIVDCLPRHEDLPPGVYLLLTSRPEREFRAQLWDRVTRVLNIASPSLVIKIEQTDDRSQGYYELLRDYVDHELGRDPTKPAAQHDRESAFASLLEKSECRFSYLAYLVERLIDGTLDVEDLKRLPSGDRLVTDFEMFLRTHLGEKRFEHAKQLILTLAAAEEVHDWEVRHPDYPSGVLDTTWHGLSTSVLAELMNDPGDEADGPSVSFLALVFTLKSVLSAWRGSGGNESRFRLGLREMTAQIRSHWRMDLANLHRHIFDWCVEQLQTDQRSCSTPTLHYLLRNIWGHASLSDWNSRTPEYAGAAEVALRSLAGAVGLNALEEDIDDAAMRIAIGSEAVAIGGILGAVGAAPGAWYAVFRFRISRALALRQLGRYTQSIADLSKSIELMERIGAAMGPQWPLSWRSDLAGAYGDRAAIQHLGDAGDSAHALRGVSRSIEILTQIQAASGGNWSDLDKFNLATGYNNRGEARRHRNDLIGATGDFNRSIELLDKLPNSPVGVGLHPRHLLAQALDNIALVYRDSTNPQEAIAGHDRAIDTMETLRTTMGAKWHVEAQDSLAAMYEHRASTKVDAGLLDDAFADFDKAIALSAEIRSLAAQRWTAVHQTNLAGTYRSRAAAYSRIGNGSAATLDYDRAIDITEALHAQLKGDAPLAWRIELSKVYITRAVASMVDEPRAPDAYTHRGIALMEEIYALIGDELPVRDRAGLAIMRIFRGRRYDAIDEMQKALADFDHGIALMDTESVLGAIPLVWRRHLANTYKDRARRREEVGKSADAAADRARADQLERQAAALEAVDPPTGISPQPSA